MERTFAGAMGSDTVAAISAFISTYPESHLADDAQSAKARLLARDEAHSRAMASDNPIVLESFLNSYPNGPRADEICGRLRKLQLKADDDVRLADARRRAEAEVQQQKEERDAFIATYPKSHLAADAQKEKARLLARDLHGDPPPGTSA